MYTFLSGSYTIIYKYHHQGIVAIVSKEGEDYKAKFGLTPTRKAYNLYEFDWIQLTSNYEKDKGKDLPDTVENASYILVSHLQGGSIGESDDSLYLSEGAKQLLMALGTDMTYRDRSEKDWVPNYKFYILEEDGVRCYDYQGCEEKVFPYFVNDTCEEDGVKIGVKDKVKERNSNIRNTFKSL